MLLCHNEHSSTHKSTALRRCEMEEYYRYFHYNVSRYEFDQAFKLYVKRNLTMDELVLKGMEMFLFLSKEEWSGGKLLLIDVDGREIPLSVMHMPQGNEPAIHEQKVLCCSGIKIPYKLEFALPQYIFERFKESPMANVITEKRAISIGITLFVFFDAEEDDGATFFLESVNGSRIEIFML